MIYYAPTIIMLYNMIIISVAVALAALFSLSDSLLTILLLYIVVLSNKYVPSFLYIYIYIYICLKKPLEILDALQTLGKLLSNCTHCAIKTMHHVFSVSAK